jgi:hypothetical protein
MVEYRISLPGIMWPGLGVDHPPPFRAEIKKNRATLLRPLWTFMVCSRANFTFNA